MEYKYESSCESGTDKMGTRYGPGGSARSINFNFVQGKGHLLRHSAECPHSHRNYVCK